MKLLYLVPVLLLTGCTSLSTLFTAPSTFDSTLYDRTISLWFESQADVTSCGTPAINEQILTLNRESKQLVKYTEYASKDLNSSFVLVDKAISEMNSVYQIGTPSTAYCKIKLEIIGDDLDAILQGIGGKSK